MTSAAFLVLALRIPNPLPAPMSVEPAPAAGDAETEEAKEEEDAASSGDEEATVEPPDQGDGDGDDGEDAGQVEVETVEGRREAAGDEDIDMASIFGSSDDLELEELEEGDSGKDSAAGGGGGGLAARFPGEFDARLRILSSVYVDLDNVHNDERWTNDDPSRFQIGRNENRLEFYLAYSPNEHIQIVGDVEPVFMGVSQVSDLNDLATRQNLTPFHVESDAAYVAVYDALPGLDIKLGRQIVVWGTADKFNPTNNINPDDLEDRPLFTEPIANQMLVVDFAPWGDKLWAQGVYVPLFYPALLPPSASAALQDPKSPVPFVNQEDLDALAFLQNYIDVNPKFRPLVVADVAMPERSLSNGQAAFRLGSRLGDVDLSASYYYGFHDIPLPVEAVSTMLAPLSEENPSEGYWFRSDVALLYPRMHVGGLDFATQLPFLGHMGLWGEAAVIFPVREYEMRLELPLSIDVTSQMWDDGVANPVSEVVGPTVLTTPFVKATAGADYTIGKHLYLQAQYLRGMIDEFGAGNLGNYLVSGGELVFFGRHLIFRMFTVVDFPRGEEDTPSVVLAPDLIMVPPWGYVTFELGGFAFLGDIQTKFGQRATGSSIAYLKVAGAF